MADPEETPPPEPDSPEEEVVAILEGIGYQGLEEVGAANRAHAIAKLMTTSWEDLEAIEVNDNLLFPDVLIRRKVDGSWHQEDVFLRVPRDRDLRQSRVEARALAVKEKIDEKQDRDLFVNLENMCILARCIRNTTHPYESMHPDPLLLEAKFDKVCLQHMWEKLERLSEVLNPAPNQLSSGEIVALIVAIARARHLGPLIVYGPGAQTSFVVSTADLLLNLLGSKLSSGALEHWMREYSAKNDSPN